jgi:RND family efflux transporter MFP subunit
MPILGRLLGADSLRIGPLLAIVALGLAACDSEPEAVDPVLRPVRVVTVEEREASGTVVLTGTVEATDEAALAFRIGGRMVERLVERGDTVEPGELVARLDARNEENALRAAEANLVAAEGQLVQARNHFQRQQHLMDRGFAARAVYDDAKQGYQTARSQVEAAEAQRRFALDQVGFTELDADAEGVVTEIGAEPGEVVQAGQMIVGLAREGGRDAVFDVPAQVLRTAPGDPVIAIVLSDDPSVTATGRVREVAPRADPVTRTFEVKVGIIDPPEEMRLGASVSGRMNLEAGAMIQIPAGALTSEGGEAAVWVVEPESLTVSLRPIEVASFGPAKVGIYSGLEPGEVVVVAGVQALHPGQQVRLLDAVP